MTEDKKTEATKIIELVIPFIELFIDQTKEPYARVKIDGHKFILPVKGTQFSQWVSGYYYRIKESVASLNSIKTAIETISANARFNGKEYQLYNRVCWHEGAIWYDLGNWQAVKITKDGWEVIDDTPILFKHYSHQKAHNFIRTEGNNSIEKLFNIVNITDKNSQILFKTSLVAAFVPDIPHPVNIGYGDHGSAKSTAFKVMKALIDPSTIEQTAFPSSKAELAQFLNHHYFIGFDNISYLSNQHSDILCRAVTGDGFSKRGLYTDDEDIIYKIKRCISLNGINLVATKPDLLDRSLLLKFERIPDEQRKTETKLWDEFYEVKNEILTAIFDTISKAIKIHTDIKLDKLPRMADFAVWACAITEALGCDKQEFLDSFELNVQEQNNEALENSVIGELILDFMAERKINKKGDWIKTPTDLYIEIKKLAELKQVGQSFPRAPHALTRKINSIKVNLLKAGIKYESHHNGVERVISLSINAKTVSFFKEKKEGEYNNIKDLEANSVSTVIGLKPASVDQEDLKNDSVTKRSALNSVSSPEKLKCVKNKAYEWVTIHNGIVNQPNFEEFLNWLNWQNGNICTREEAKKIVEKLFNVAPYRDNQGFIWLENSH